MRLRLPKLAALALLVPSAAAADPLTGRWLTADRSALIAIAPCGPRLCGTIVGVLLDRPDDPLPTDFQHQPQCGFRLLRDIVPDADSGWTARIVDPRDGAVYHAHLRLDGAGRLRVRGYIGIPLLGQTQVWSAFPGPVPRDCRLPAPKRPGP